MEAPNVIDKIHEFNDLELAALLCLIANEHCIISTSNDVLNELEKELQLVSDLPSQRDSQHANTITRPSLLFLAFQQL